MTLRLKPYQGASLVEGGDPTIAEHIGDVYMKMGNFKMSIEMYQKALTLKHQNPDAINRKIEEMKRKLE
jgi:tetratricopeptide (TPR) repeat protein